MLILASTSHTRRMLLTNAGLSFEAAAPAVDERALAAEHPDWTPADTSLKLAEAKALDVSRRHTGALVIGADQVLALGKRSYAKPGSITACRQQLLELRGKTHQLISSVVCARAGKSLWNATDTVHLTMRDFSSDFLEDYLGRNGERCLSSVGGYQIEGLGLQLFDKVEGDYFAILGIPLMPLLAYLRQAGELRT